MKPRFARSVLFTISVTIILAASFALADVQRGTLVHDETIRVTPNPDAAKLGEAFEEIGRAFGLNGGAR